VAQVVIGQADFFRTEEQRDFGTRLQMLMDDLGRGFEAMELLLWGAAGAGGGANDERTVGDGIGHLIEFLRCLEDRFGVDGGAGFAKGDVVGMDDAEVLESEVGHGASGRPDVERVAAADEDDPEAIGFCRGEHDRPF
jgi:hypothetical protein